MLEKPQKTNFWQKLKNTKVNRAAVVTGVVLIASIVTIIAVTVSTNRAKKDEIDDLKRPEQTTELPAETDTKEPEKDPSVNTNKPTGNNISQVENKLPSFILPVNGVLSVKHDAEHQVFSPTLNDHRVHLGIDIVTAADAPVYAAADGKVDKIWEDPMMGNCLAIKHGGNSYTIYKNLSSTLPEGIAEGVSVRSGQMIGTVGGSAMVELAQEPHLHFEMTVADLLVDPLQYFDEKSLEALSLDSSHGE